MDPRTGNRPGTLRGSEGRDEAEGNEASHGKGERFRHLVRFIVRAHDQGPQCQMSRPLLCPDMPASEASNAQLQDERDQPRDDQRRPIEALIPPHAFPP